MISRFNNLDRHEHYWNADAGKSDDLENLFLGGRVSLVRQLLGWVEILEMENALLNTGNTMQRAENAALMEQVRAL